MDSSYRQWAYPQAFMCGHGPCFLDNHACKKNYWAGKVWFCFFPSMLASSWLNHLFITKINPLYGGVSGPQQHAIFSTLTWLPICQALLAIKLFIFGRLFAIYLAVFRNIRLFVVFPWLFFFMIVALIAVA